MKTVLLFLVVVCAMSMVAQAGIVQTYPGAPLSGVYGTDWTWCMFSDYQNVNVVDQTFTVPVGQTCTEVAFLVEKDGASEAGWYVNMQIFDSSGNYLGGVSKSVADFVNSRDWVVKGGLNLQPGSYLAQVFTNNDDLKPYLATPMQLTDTYAGGYACGYWGGTHSIGSGGYDFNVNLTMVPEPATLGLLAIGGFLIRRRLI